MQTEMVFNPTRRNFLKMAGTGAIMVSAGGLSLATSGCNIIQDIQNWIPVGLAALNSIQTLLGPLVSPAVTPFITIIKTGFADLLAATQAYANDTNPADKATSIAKIQTALNDITTNFENLFNTLPGGAIVSLAFGLAQIVLTTIAGFITQLPPAPATSSLKMRTTFTIKGQAVNIVPVKRSVRRFKGDWNSAAVAAGHPELKMHVSFLEHL